MRVLLLLLALARGAAADPFADAVAAVSIGPGGGAGTLDDVLGPPDGAGAFKGSTHTLSLGLGGSITLAFTNNVIVDGPGVDFTVFENAFLTAGETTGAPYAEPGTVSVSDDGEHWVTFPCALDQPPYHPGCAGVYPVFATAADPGSALVPSTTPVADLVGVPLATFVPPAGSGGDSFDLAGTGLAEVRFVRIDASDMRVGLDGLAGFDLDAVAAVHSRELAHEGDDPCPAGVSCGPWAPFGGGSRGDADGLLTYAAPVRRRVEVARDATTVTFVASISDDVDRVTLRVDGRDGTSLLGAVVPASTMSFTVPLARDRTVVRLHARSRRGRSDTDRFIIRRRGLP